MGFKLERVTKLQVIEVVHSHGGDVIKFAGDAMIVAFCPFRSEQGLEDQGYSAAVTRCALCAEVVRSQLS
jgi:class 3 adenylate cyclase